MIHHRVLRAGWPAVSATLAILAVFFCGVTPAALWAETRPILPGYATFVDLESRLRRLGESSWAELCSLGKTAQGRDIWLLTIAADPAQSHPAVLVLGNVHVPHLLGRELALRMAERLVNTAGEDEAVGRFLSAHTVYLIACPSPDATEKNATVPARSGGQFPAD